MITYILILAFYIFFIAFVWKDLVRGIYFVILLLPTYLIRFYLFGVPMTLLEGMILLLFLMWLIKLYLNKRLDLTITQWLRNKFQPEATQIKHIRYNLIPTILRWPILLFITAATIALFFSAQTMAAAGIWKAYFIEPIMFLLIFVYHVKKNSQLNKIITGFALLTLIIFIYALIQKLTGWNINNINWYLPETRRITTFFGYPNANGLLLAPLGVLLFSTLWLKEKLWLKIIKFVAFISSILTIIWAGSEGALVAMAFGTLIILIAKKRTRFLAAFLVGLFILLIIINPTVKGLFLEKITISDFSGQIRQAQWLETLTMLKDRPIMGGGLASYQMAIEPYHQTGIVINGQWQPVEIFLYPHNFFLTFWSETGFLGLIAIVWLLISIGILIYRINIKKKWLPKYKKNYITNLSLGLTAAFVTIIIHGLVDVPYFKNDLSIVFWILIGILIVLYNHTVNKNIARLE